MALTCILSSVKDTIRKAIASGDLNLDKLYDMSSADRRELFSQFTNEQSAKLLNAAYEQARVDATKRAMADYVTASEKGEFAQTSTKANFAQKILSDEATKKIQLGKIEDKLNALKNQQETVSKNLENETNAEKKANLQFKLNKLKDQQARLETQKADTENSVTDKLVKKIQATKNLLDPGTEKQLMDDLVESKMGTKLTDAQGKYIIGRASRLQELGRAIDKNPHDTNSLAEYINTKNSLNTYIDSLSPHSSALAIVGNIVELSRDNLLGNLSVPIKALIGNTETATSAIIRRLSHMSLRGDNYDAATKLYKEAEAVYKKTGVEPSTLHNFDDTGSVLGSHAGEKGDESFAPPQQAKNGGALEKIEGATGKLASWARKAVIDWGHNKQFTYFYRNTFHDTLNFSASDMAKQEGLKGNAMRTRAAEIMEDAARIEPKTPAGKILRTHAQLTAAKIMNVDNNWATKISVGLKNTLNTAFGKEAHVGDFIEPVAKIGANIIKGGIDMTPVGLGEGGKDIVMGRLKATAKDSTLEEKYEGMNQYKNGVERIIAVAGSVAVASLLTAGLTKKDFRSDAYGNHFVDFGGTWVNTEYFSRLGPNIAGMMALKENPPSNPLQAASEFLIGKKVGEGALGGILNIPGVNVLSGTAQGILSNNLPSTLSAQIKSRLLPGSVWSVLGTRPIDRLFFGASGVESEADYKQDLKIKAQRAAETRRANALRAREAAQQK